MYEGEVVKEVEDGKVVVRFDYDNTHTTYSDGDFRKGMALYAKEHPSQT